MKDRAIHLVAGLPRSGSTLLMNLLGQNPAIHVTPTSGLVDLVAGVARQWRRNLWLQAEGLEVRPYIEQLETFAATGRWAGP